MNFFSIVWTKLVGMFREANLHSLEPIPVHVEEEQEEEDPRVPVLKDKIEWAKTAAPALGAEAVKLDPALIAVLRENDASIASAGSKPPKKQLTKNFHIDEFKCHDGRGVPAELYGNVLKLAENLQVLRDVIGKPIKIMSGYRHLEYNRKIGGARRSQHMEATAADIRVKGISPAKLADIIDGLVSEGLMSKGGLGRYPTFTHYDVRGKNARWGGSRKTT